MNQKEEKGDSIPQEFDNRGKISQYLKMKGSTRLEVKEVPLVNRILEFDYDKYPGINLRFLETKKKSLEFGDWIEFNILFEANKHEESVDYLSYLFKSISKIISSWSDISNIDVVGIQEVECAEPNYYILIYILSNGKDKKKETDN